MYAFQGYYFATAGPGRYILETDAKLLGRFLFFAGDAAHGRTSWSAGSTAWDKSGSGRDSTDSLATYGFELGPDKSLPITLMLVTGPQGGLLSFNIGSIPFPIGSKIRYTIGDVAPPCAHEFYP